LLYSKTDVLIHPVKEQGGWLTPFEAISAGVPIIVSPELTCHQTIYENALGDVSKFYAGSINSVYRYQGVDVFDRNQELCKRWVKNNLTWDKFGESMVKYFQEIVNHA
jgi:glycosyltransferase involved in cell wall biosynthesis